MNLEQIKEIYYSILAAIRAWKIEDDLIVVGPDAAMVLYGMWGKTETVDFYVAQAVIDQYDAWHASFSSNARPIPPEVTLRPKSPTLDEYESAIYDGIYTLSIDGLLDFRRKSGTADDMIEVARINNYLADHGR